MITKIYYVGYVYLYHYELQLKSIIDYIISNVIDETNFLLKWKDGEDLIGIVR